jgi:hypothetical protein
MQNGICEDWGICGMEYMKWGKCVRTGIYKDCNVRTEDIKLISVIELRDEFEVEHNTLLTRYSPLQIRAATRSPI